MITYMRCNDASMEHIFQAFLLGFWDYSIRLTTVQDDFAARFFGPEGNTRNYSFLAMDEDQPIGLILGGVRQFDGYKTMRYGTLCVAPAYRGQGISNKLLELHKQPSPRAASSYGSKSSRIIIGPSNYMKSKAISHAIR
ncbi:hypothetical protein GMA19_04826 [Paenibacillus polymyxa E681]|uniref:GNAT family N-acetyltransferase n=1 Tax=Paenibacillus polymyxa TaxID=1406 RepID=UPI0001E32208|nr:GNAT family N-acetyltransferase [Paenibacillus polymyxa]QNV59609.1 hypothetical protein GE561_04837 [Paenibacillus polymyxa E681]QNV64435.1 hypothetical protein GMA19_04826 [Paenibacillus polymyxa E681]